MYLSIYRSIYLFIDLSIYFYLSYLSYLSELPIYLPIYLSTYLSIHPSHVSIYPSHPVIYPVYPIFSILSILSTIYLSVCLSFNQSIYLEMFFGEGKFTRHGFRNGTRPRLPGDQFGRTTAWACRALVAGENWSILGFG